MSTVMSIILDFIRRAWREPSKPSSDTAPFHFLDLPAELRNKIYYLLLVAPNGEMICSRQGFRADVQILGVCQQVFSEASPILYGQNEFHLIAAGLHTVNDGNHGWTNAGIRNTKFVRRLRVDSYSRSLRHPFNDEQSITASSDAGQPVLNFIKIASCMPSLESFTLRCCVDMSFQRQYSPRDMAASCLMQVAQKTHMKVMVHVPSPTSSWPGCTSSTMRLLSREAFKLLPQVDVPPTTGNEATSKSKQGKLVDLQEETRALAELRRQIDDEGAEQSTREDEWLNEEEDFEQLRAEMDGYPSYSDGFG